MTPLGGPRLNIGVPFGLEKLEWWLLDSRNSLRIRLAVSPEYRRVTDRRTDKHIATA